MRNRKTSLFWTNRMFTNGAPLRALQIRALQNHGLQNHGLRTRDRQIRDRQTHDLSRNDVLRNQRRRQVHNYNNPDNSHCHNRDLGNALQDSDVTYSIARNRRRRDAQSALFGLVQTSNLKLGQAGPPMPRSQQPSRRRRRSPSRLRCDELRKRIVPWSRPLLNYPTDTSRAIDKM